MRFSRRLITPVLAAVMLVGGAAFAQEAIYDTLDGETVDFGIISWSYDKETKTFTWGDLDGCAEAEASADPVVDELVAEVASDGELHFDSNCRTVSFGDSEYEAEIGVTGDDAPNHGQMVSGFGEQLRGIDKDELDGNRGSFMSEIAKLVKIAKGEDVEEESGDTGSEDVESDSESKGAKPDKDTGKPDSAPGKPEK